MSTSCSFVDAGRLVRARDGTFSLSPESQQSDRTAHTENDNLKVSRSMSHSHFPTEITSRVMRTQKMPQPQRGANWMRNENMPTEVKMLTMIIWCSNATGIHV